MYGKIYKISANCKRRKLSNKCSQILARLIRKKMTPDADQKKWNENILNIPTFYRKGLVPARKAAKAEGYIM